MKTKHTEHNGECALSGVTPRRQIKHAHHILPRACGGSYSFDNIQYLEPREHMRHHGILRERSPEHEELKGVFDDRQQMIRLRNKIDNQFRAYEHRVDEMRPDTQTALESVKAPIEERIARVTAELSKLVKHLAKSDPLVDAALKVKGLGPVTAAALTIYVDLTKASTPSALWKYAGLHTASHKRYQKGEASGGNKTLRTVLYTMAESMMKLRVPGYREIYDRTKARLEASAKITMTRNGDGKVTECEWRNTKSCHRHGAALRAIIKQSLCDYWITGRTLAGLPITTPYVEGVLGHTDIIPATERGWKI
jgi:hypothetical protein